MKKNYSLLFACFICAIVSSCKKDTFEVTPDVQPESGSVQQDALIDPQDQNSPERNMGCVLLSPIEYSKLPKLENEIIPESLPPVVNLSCPPIQSQGQEGSCVAFGTAYAARSIMQKILSGGSFALNTNCYSPEYIFNQIKISTCSNGSHIIDAFNLMKNKGVCTWAQMPYSSTNGCSLLPTTKQKNAALFNKITGYSTISINTTSIKNQLALNKPVIVGGPVDTTFWYGVTYVYSTYNSADFVGNHCYCIVGYDDSKNAFKVMNSWGTNWANSGFGWINYSLTATMFQEAYVINGLL